MADFGKFFWRNRLQKTSMRHVVKLKRFYRFALIHKHIWSLSEKILMRK